MRPQNGRSQQQQQQNRSRVVPPNQRNPQKRFFNQSQRWNGQSQRRQNQGQRSRSDQICFEYNARGTCRFSGPGKKCDMKHVCSVEGCNQAHPRYLHPSQ